MRCKVKFKSFLGILFLFIVLTAIISATFELGDYQIEKSYAPGSNLKGYITLNLNSEASNSLFTTSSNGLDGNNISLINLIRKNPSFVYNCTPSNCGALYNPLNPAETKLIGLSPEQSKSIGIKLLPGKVTGIRAIDFSFLSTLTDSCTNQIEIYFFNNYTTYMKNTNISSLACESSKTYGCFDPSKQQQLWSLNPSNPYCQKITLPVAPAYELGALIQKEAGMGQPKMMLYKVSDAKYVADCDAPIPTQAEQEIFCNLSLSLPEPQEFYVCIQSNSPYGKIKGYQDTTSGCGFYGKPKLKEEYSYSIFARGKQYGTLNKDFNNSFNDNADSNTFDRQAISYLKQTYGSDMICPSDGCILPITFKAKQNMIVNLKALRVMYSETGGELTENNFYDLDESIALITTANSQKLYLDQAGLKVPEETGTSNIILNFNNQQLFSENIVIKAVPTVATINPLNTVAALPTRFKVFTTKPSSSKITVTGYNWDFGDNTQAEATSESFATHTYNSVGKYTLTITITNSDSSTSTKSFEITVENPKQAINSTIKTYLASINSLETELNSLPQFYKDSLSPFLDLNEKKSEITSIQRSYLNSSCCSETGYIDLMKKLAEIEVPNSIKTLTSIQSAVFTPKKSDISLSILGGDVNENADKYPDAIIMWNKRNIDTKINYKELGAVYTYNTGSLVRIFELKITEKNSLSKKPHIIIKELENMKLSKNATKRENGYVLIDLNNLNDGLMISTTEEINPNTLPLFISPDLSELTIQNTSNCENGVGEGCPEQETGLSLYLILGIIVVVLIVAAAIYFFFFRKKTQSSSQQNIKGKPQLKPPFLRRPLMPMQNQKKILPKTIPSGNMRFGTQNFNKPS